MGSECENNLFIHAETDERKEYFMNILNRSDKLFESFIPLSQTKLECYGTSSDVYIEYIEVKLVLDLIILKFYTYQTPCIEFAKRLAGRYSLNVQLHYYNEESDFSGEVSIYRNQLMKEEHYSYLQGVYFNNRESFWQKAYEKFNESWAFMDFILAKGLSMNENDFNRLKRLYDEFLFCGYFNKTIQ